MEACSGLVFDIKRFALHDGPGIRSTVFLKGCPLRCAWCHNPEGLEVEASVWQKSSACIHCGRCLRACRYDALAALADGRIVCRRENCTLCGACVEACPTGAMRLDAKVMTVEQVMAELRKDRHFYAASEGGMTLSGGEPTMQPAFAEALLEAAQAEGMDTALESSLFCPRETIDRLLPHLDRVYADIKTLPGAAHQAITGVDNALILDNFRRIAGADVALTCRVPVIPGYTDSEENIRGITRFVRECHRDIPMELMAYNPLGASKYADYGQEYALGKASADQDHYRRLQEIARSEGVRVL